MTDSFGRDQPIEQAGLDFGDLLVISSESPVIRVYSGRSESGYHMRSAASVLAPPLFAAEAFTDATTAVARLDEIYDRNTRFLRDRFEAYVNGEPPVRSIDPVRNPADFARHRKSASKKERLRLEPIG